IGKGHPLATVGQVWGTCLTYSFRGLGLFVEMFAGRLQEFLILDVVDGFWSRALGQRREIGDELPDSHVRVALAQFFEHFQDLTADGSHGNRSPTVGRWLKSWARSSSMTSTGTV